jgi:RNA polymerase sigma-70 factor (ECF subfamily)
MRLDVNRLLRFNLKYDLEPGNISSEDWQSGENGCNQPMWRWLILRCMTSALVIPLTLPAFTVRPHFMEYEESTLPSDVIRAAQTGDEGAFRAILRACKGRLLGMASRYVQSPAELDDLGQEIFVHIWKGLRTYRFDAPFPNWLSRVAVNTCLTHIKRRRRRWSLFVAPEEPGSLDKVADVSGEAEASGREAAERLRPALEALKPKDRLVITLLHLDERPVAEVAALTGWSESNVKVRALRARLKLKALLKLHEDT